MSGDEGDLPKEKNFSDDMDKTRLLYMLEKSLCPLFALTVLK